MATMKGKELSKTPVSARPSGPPKVEIHQKSQTKGVGNAATIGTVPTTVTTPSGEPLKGGDGTNVTEPSIAPVTVPTSSTATGHGGNQ